MKNEVHIPQKLWPAIESIMAAKNHILDNVENGIKISLEATEDANLQENFPKAWEYIQAIREAKKRFFIPRHRSGKWAMGITLKHGLRDGKTNLYWSRFQGGPLYGKNANNIRNDIEKYLANPHVVLGEFLTANGLSENTTKEEVANLMAEEKNEESLAFYGQLLKYMDNPRLLASDAGRHISPPYEATYDNVKKQVGESLLENVDNMITMLSTEDKEVWVDLEKHLREVLQKKGFPVHLTKRNYTPGYSTDFNTAFGTFFIHGAGYASRLATKKQTQEALDSTDPHKDKTEHDYVRSLLSYYSSPMEELQHLRNFGFIALLGWSPSTAMLQAASVPMIAGPYMSQFAPVGKVMAALGKYSTTLKINPVISDNDKKVLEIATKEGITSPLMQQEQWGSSAESRLLPSKFTTFLTKLTAKSGWLNSRVESKSRSWVFLAAYHLGQEPEVQEKI
ncbi:MAG: hypothetical protein AAB875_01865, partial [Patescibacteria group bacterium]